MTWTETTTARDAEWDAWANTRYGVECWEQLEPEQVAELMETNP